MSFCNRQTAFICIQIHATLLTSKSLFPQICRVNTKKRRYVLIYIYVPAIFTVKLKQQISNHTSDFKILR